MVTCEKCVYFFRLDYGDGFEGLCDRGRSDNGKRVENITLAYALDAEEYNANLVVKPDFGCVMGEYSDPLDGLPDVIETEEQHARVMDRIKELWDNDDPYSNFERSMLVDLVQEYEKENVEVDLPDPASAIEFRMDQAGLTFDQVAQTVGSVMALVAILNRRRAPTIQEARALWKTYGIPADALLNDPMPAEREEE